MSGAPVAVVVHPDKASLADCAGARLLIALIDAQAAGRDPQVALTGGSMGSAIIASLAAQPGRDAVDFSRVHVWWGDERYLPAGDADRNDIQNDEAGLTALGLRPERIHRVAGPDATADAEESASLYAEALRAQGSGSFDLVLLGVGPDAHVASLFPHHEAQRTGGTITVAVHDSPKPPPDRVSLTFEALNRARQVWFLVAGADKADAVAAALDPDAERWDTPASGVRGSEGTYWLLDRAAASEIESASA